MRWTVNGCKGRNLTIIRYFDTEKNEKLPVRKLISEKKNSGDTTSLSLRAGGRGKDK